MKIKITLPNGKMKEYPKGVLAEELAKDFDKELVIRLLAVEINGKLYDTNRLIEESGEIIFHTFDTPQGKEIYWHSTAHLMAQAVKQLFPDVKVTIGPAIEEGFYYDFDKDSPFTDEDLQKIEQRMEELMKERLPYQREELTRKQAISQFKKMGETYKIEIIEELPKDETISVYTQGDFIDLCRGPHLPHTGKIKAVKLLKTSGAYWRGDENNKMLVRIYGISFPSKKELKDYLDDLEERKKRDHRKLGKELDLFSISDDIGPGLVLWHPNGAMIRSLIEDYWKQQHFEAGYQVVNTPHIGKAELWKTSGHLDFYNESMYAPIEVEGQMYYLKPMNCPFHITIYKTDKRSYRELPLRYAEMGTVYRYERSGVLHGLMRVRGFTQDDAHIICTPEQLDEEVDKLITFSLSILRKFGFQTFELYLATKPEKFVGDEKMWDEAAAALKKGLENQNLEYQMDEGGGAFYGPKIDIKIRDALNRSWQCTTIQFDFNLPERFDMEYIGADNKAHRPYMIHRALLGSMERFFGTLIEYHAGNFPFWLAPVQIIIVPVSESYERYAARICEKIVRQGFRAKVDFRSEKVGYKIRDAELKKIPFMVIIGQREEDNNTLSLRKHREGDIGSYTFDEAITELRNEMG
ncbi:MAG: threonine--tRNA ligase [Candidatus Cloacimonetes bacterium]|nr:threonine--tRNA ligase [Candidatus Cloacimonadota bacterium]